MLHSAADAATTAATPTPTPTGREQVREKGGGKRLTEEKAQTEQKQPGCHGRTVTKLGYQSLVKLWETVLCDT